MLELATYEQGLIERFVAENADSDEIALVPGTLADRWFLASQLQKTIRRGLAEHAVCAALQLSELDAAYLWRRLRIIALEDVGLANPTLVATVLAIAGKVALHRALGVWRTIRAAVTQLAESRKSRTACDVSCWTALVDVLPAERHRLVGTSPTNWTSIAVAEEHAVWRRCLALQLIGGLTLHTPRGFRTISRFDRKALAHVLDVFDSPLPIRYLAMRGRNTDGLNSSIVLAESMLRGSEFVLISDRSRPGTEAMIGPGIAAAYCMYTHAGNTAFAHWLKQDVELRRELSKAGATNPARALGYLIFHVEGSVLNRRWATTVCEQARSDCEQAECRYVGLTAPVEMLHEFVRARLPALDRIRFEVYRQTIAQRPLPGIPSP